MLAIPLKATDQSGSKSVEWDKALHKFVSRTYSPKLADAHEAQFAAVNDQRKQIGSLIARGITPATAEGTEKLLIRYFRLLCAVEKRFAGSDLRMQFSWRDSFEAVAKQGEADVHFESAAVLYNLCAVCSFLAVHQSRTDAEGIKAACQRYQQTAGLLELLEAHVRSSVWCDRGTVDLKPSTLQMMRKLMLAQAQRCFYEKAALDAMNPKLLSKISAQVGVVLRRSAAGAWGMSRHNHVTDHVTTT
jgi:programmed cell death 6-interacting protein